MREDHSNSVQARSAVKWGGIAGMLGSLSLLVVFGFLAALVGLETVDVEAEISRYPDIRTTRIVENVMYLLAIALWAIHTAALLVALRRTSFATALSGAVMMGLGLAILATGAVPHIATDPIVDLYHEPATSDASKTTLVAIWHAVQGIVDALVITGMTLASLGMGLFGVAMLKNAHYGGWSSWLGLLLAVVAVVAALISLYSPGDMIALAVFALIFFHALFGWKTMRAG